MSKVAIMTDSNSGITQKEANKLGIYVLPMPFMIEGETYFEGINLSQTEFYNKLTKDVSISTSQPSPESLMKLWDKALEKADEIVYIPMSSSLSGSCQTAMMLAQEDEYEGKVFVVDNKRVSISQKNAVLEAIELGKKGYTAEQIKQMLEETSGDASIYIMVDTLKYLKRGGRLTPAAAALGTLLRLKPVLKLEKGKLDSFAKCRTVTQARSTMVQALKEDVEKKFGGLNGEKVVLGIAHTQNEEAALSLKEELLAAFPGYTEVSIHPLSLSVSCHIGPGSLAVCCCRKHPETE